MQNATINPKAFIAQMEKKHANRVAGRRRLVGRIGGINDFRFFTRRRRINPFHPRTSYPRHIELAR